MRPTFLTMDLAALTHNLALVQSLAPGRKIIAMVKANGYGHGLVKMAEHLTQADALGVASIDEAIQLREAGITQPIILMEGVFTAEEVQLAAHYDFGLVVHQELGLRLLELAQQDLPPFTVWLKINTGMNRLGLPPRDVMTTFLRLQQLAIVKKPIGLMTHFANADAADLASAKKQIDLFQQTTADLVGPRSLANSAAIMRLPESLGDWVRPGLMLYGASPIAAISKEPDQLQPVMTFWTRIIAINELQPGDQVGYGSSWTAEEPMRIGVIAAGYGDGYPQFAKSGTPVLINGVLSQIVGRVSMDMITVDLRPCPEAMIGDKVTLWGQGLPAQTIAQHNHTSAYELFTRITARPRVEYK